MGPKVYISRGPSGHPETFQRPHADAELQKLLGDRPTRVIVEGFLRKLKAERRMEGWDDVLAYLGTMLEMEPDLVPLDAAVAFWAHVSMEQEAAKRLDKKGT